MGQNIENKSVLHTIFFHSLWTP